MAMVSSYSDQCLFGQVLLVTSSRGSGWIIPGGKVEQEEMDRPEMAAGREAREEAGVVGRRRSSDLSMSNNTCILTRQYGEIFRRV